MHSEDPCPALIVVMGVSGCGKSTVGRAIAAALRLSFVEGDDLHPPANRAKMASGVPLDDEDRAPWLDRIADRLTSAHAARQGVVIACSALRRSYRQRLRAHLDRPLIIVHLAGSRDVIAKRLGRRRRHFMPAALLDSQFATLEPLSQDEAGIIPIAVDIDRRRDDVTASALAAIAEADR